MIGVSSTLKNTCNSVVIAERKFKMEALVGWGLVLAGVFVAREIARQQEEREAAPEPVPVRSDEPKRREK
jgi:hypothetical protein